MAIGDADVFTAAQNVSGGSTFTSDFRPSAGTDFLVKSGAVYFPASFSAAGLVYYDFLNSEVAGPGNFDAGFVDAMPIGVDANNSGSGTPFMSQAANNSVGLRFVAENNSCSSQTSELTAWLIQQG